MKAWQVRAWGEPETMEFAEVELPAPGPRQVRIRNPLGGTQLFRHSSDSGQVSGQASVSVHTGR